MAKFEQILWERFGNILKRSFKNHNKSEIACYTSLKPCTDFFFKIKAFIMAQSGDEAASKSDVTSLDTKQDLDIDNDTLKGK